MFQLKASVETVSTLANHCLTIRIDTQDISLFTPEELSELFKLNEKEVWVAIKELEIKPEEIKVEDAELSKKKSAHQRFYDVCLAYKKVTTGKFDGADELYRKTLDRVSEQLLDKIKEYENTNTA